VCTRSSTAFRIHDTSSLPSADGLAPSDSTLYIGGTSGNGGSIAPLYVGGTSGNGGSIAPLVRWIFSRSCPLVYSSRRVWPLFARTRSGWNSRPGAFRVCYCSYAPPSPAERLRDPSFAKKHLIQFDNADDWLIDGRRFLNLRIIRLCRFGSFRRSLLRRSHFV
jgi:hypothetical protein